MTKLNNQENWAEQLENAVDKDVEKDEIRVELISVTSKAGKPYKALQVTVGEYEVRVFPTKFELKYLETVL